MGKDCTASISEHPNVEAIITNRIAQGRYVVDHEELTGVSESFQGAVVVIYEVRERNIVNVWFLE